MSTQRTTLWCGNGNVAVLYPVSLDELVWWLGFHGSSTGDRVVSGRSSKLWAKSSVWALPRCIWQTAELVAATTQNTQTAPKQKLQQVISWSPLWIQCTFTTAKTEVLSHKYSWEPVVAKKLKGVFQYIFKSRPFWFIYLNVLTTSPRC